MPRKPRDHRLETIEARRKLAPRKEPYWRQIVPGTFVGYYRGERGGAWIARQRDAEGGYKSQRLGTADDQAQADGEIVLNYSQAVKLAQQIQIERRQPLPRHYGEGLTLNALFEEYLLARQTTPGGRSNRVMPSSTANVSRASWGRHVAGIIGKELVTSLDHVALRRWHAAMAQLAPVNRGKEMPFDPADPAQVRARRSTANRVLTIVKATLGWARAHDRLPAALPDYWVRVKPFGLGDDAEPRMLESEEITRLLNAAQPDLRQLLTAAFMTGARYGELCALRVADYSPDQGLVRIHQTKTGKTLWQPLTPEGRAFFDRCSAGHSASALMFTRADGSAWSRSDAAKPMRKACEAAKVPDASFKTTRATYGKLLLIATRDLELVAKALGHSDSRITRKHYASLLPSEVAAGVARMPSLGIDNDSKVSRIGGSKRPTRVQ